MNVDISILVRFIHTNFSIFFDQSYLLQIIHTTMSTSMTIEKRNWYSSFSPSIV